MIFRRRNPNRPRRPFATLLGVLALLPLILLLQGTQFAGGTHAHLNGHASESCPVCVHAHAPAIETAGQPAATSPSVSAHRPHVAPAETPAAQASRLASSRAPPLA